VPAALTIRIRAFHEADFSFVIDSWLRSYRTAPECAGMANDMYFAGMRARVGRIAERGSVLVACLPEDAATILGWICYEPAKPGSSVVTVHYCYVKQDVRRRGVASALGEAAGVARNTLVLSSHENHNSKHLQHSYDIVYDGTLVA
jgi:GNAT superfamily N-acetyltransferase